MARRNPLKKKQASRHIEYYPTPGEVVDAYARAVCQRLGEKVDASFNTPETIREFSAFVRIVSIICAKHMNRQRTEKRSSQSVTASNQSP
jgi:hypothetical protein